MNVNLSTCCRSYVVVPLVVVIVLLVLLLLVLLQVVGRLQRRLVRLVGGDDDGHVGHVSGAEHLVAQALDVLEGGGRAGVVHQQVGGGGAEAEEPEVPPLGVGVRREVGDGREVDELELEERLVQHQRREELGLGTGGQVRQGELVGHEALKQEMLLLFNRGCKIIV